MSNILAKTNSFLHLYIGPGGEINEGVRAQKSARVRTHVQPRWLAVACLEVISKSATAADPVVVEELLGYIVRVYGEMVLYIAQ